MPQRKPAKPKRYAHPVYRFSILPPQGWSVVEPGPGNAVVAFLAPPKGGAPPHMSIEVQSAKGHTLEEYDRESKARAKKNLQDYVLTYQGVARMGNLRGREVKIAFKSGRVRVEARILYGISRGYLYVITCMALLGEYRRYGATFQKALDTFRAM